MQTVNDRIEAIFLDIKSGELNQAKRMINTMLACQSDEQACIVLETALWQVKCIREQFTISDDQLYTALTNAIRDFNRKDMEEARSQGYLVCRIIEGEQRYHQSAIKTVCRVFHKRLVDKCIIDNARAMAADNAMKGHIEDLVGQRILQISYTLKTSLRMIDKDEAEKKSLKVYLPIPRTPSLSVLSSTPTTPKIAPIEAMQRTVYFDTPVQHDLYSITYTYDMLASYHKRPLKSGLMINDEDRVVYSPFLTEKPPHIIFGEDIIKLTKKLTDTLDWPLEKARAIYDWVTQNINYTFMPDYRLIKNLSLHAMTYKSGDCGTQAILMITLLRQAGIPATFCSGRVINPLTHETGMHDWLAFYVAPYGWINADPSYGADAYRSGDINRWHFYFENCDLYRMPANQAFQEPFEHQKIWRKDPFDNQSGEAGFDRLPQRLSYETTTCVLAIKEHTSPL